MSSWIEALREWNSTTDQKWEIPKKGSEKHKQVMKIYNKKLKKESKKGGGMTLPGRRRGEGMNLPGSGLGDDVAAALVDVANNPSDTLKKAYKKTKKATKNIKTQYEKSLPRLLRGDLSAMNRMLKSDSLGDFLVNEAKRGASKQSEEALKRTVEKVNMIADSFKNNLGENVGKFMFGSGHCTKFTMKNIKAINDACCACENAQVGMGLDDIFASIAQDPIGNLTKLLKFQESNMPFKTLAENSRIGGTKPKRLFKMPWE